MEPNFRLTLDAENDLRDVARYTLNTWGRDMLMQYRDGLTQTFIAIGKGEIRKKTFSQRYPDLYAAKYRHHFIFYLSKDTDKPVIIGVIHEKRDIVARLIERLF